MMADRRAVSTTVSYTLTLGVTTLLITGLLIAGGTFLETHQEETTRTELTVIGQQLAGLVSSADGLAAATTQGSFTMSRELPATVAGSPYVIQVTNATAGGAARFTYELRLEAGNGGTDTVEVTTETPVHAPTSFTGGDIEVSYNTTGDTLVIADA